MEVSGSLANIFPTYPELPWRTGARSYRNTCHRGGNSRRLGLPREREFASGFGNSEASVWGRLLIASETSIAELHEILQLAFDLSGEYLHRCRIHCRYYGTTRLGG